MGLLFNSVWQSWLRCSKCSNIERFGLRTAPSLTFHLCVYALVFNALNDDVLPQSWLQVDTFNSSRTEIAFVQTCSILNVCMNLSKWAAGQKSQNLIRNKYTKSMLLSLNEGFQANGQWRHRQMDVWTTQRVYSVSGLYTGSTTRTLLGYGNATRLPAGAGLVLPTLALKSLQYERYNVRIYPIWRSNSGQHSNGSVRNTSGRKFFKSGGKCVSLCHLSRIRFDFRCHLPLKSNHQKRVN